MLAELDKTNIQNGAKEIWDAVGHDIFEAMKIETEINPYADKNAIPTLTRKDVIEVVLDAERLSVLLKERNEWSPEMDDLSMDEWVELVKPAFTFDVYGK